ncbi:MAG: hypothetical protein CML24_11350 [Rhizobiales bacterium]|nr:hypothetical protein [Hyphomicrobiales bacterium]
MPRYGVYRAAFEALALPGIAAGLRRFSAARGLIFTLHRVLPDAPTAFSPNSILQIRPDFLEAVIVRAREAGFDIVDLDEATRRIASEDAKPFIVLTFDDGYRDNLVHALPILRKHAAPFTLYIPTGLIDGVGLVWWQALEDIIAANDVVVVEMPEGPHYGDAGTLEQKNTTFAHIYQRYRKMPEPQREASIRTLAQRYGLDLGRTAAVSLWIGPSSGRSPTSRSALSARTQSIITSFQSLTRTRCGPRLSNRPKCSKPSSARDLAICPIPSAALPPPGRASLPPRPTLDLPLP